MGLSRRTLLGAALAAGGLAAIGCSRQPLTPATPTPPAASPTPASRAAAGTAVPAAPRAIVATPLAPTPTNTLVPPRPTVTPTPVPPTPTPVVEPPPTQIEIPKLGVIAPVVKVGLESNGDLQSPPGPREVGWFAGGPKPGEPGNALLTGHLDYRTGDLGVFWKLKELAAGDDIYVKSERAALRFSVESSWLFDAVNAPVGRILGFQIGKVITMITCEGKFIPNRDGSPGGDYTQRRIVRARFVPPA